MNRFCFLLIGIYLIFPIHLLAQPVVQSAWSIAQLDSGLITIPVGFTKPAIDSKGNMIITGAFGGSVDLDSDGIVDVATNSKADLVIASYNTAGNLNWYFQTGGNVFDHPFQDAGYGVITDHNDNVYLTGHVSGVTDFDQDGIDDFLVADSVQQFIAQFSPRGKLNWVRTLNKPLVGFIWLLNYDPINHGIYAISSHYDRCPDLSDNDCVNSEFTGLRVQHFNMIGELNWEYKTPLQETVERSIVYALGAAVNSKGELYLAGRYDGEFDFDEQDDLPALEHPFRISEFRPDTTYTTGAFFTKIDASGKILSQKSLCPTGCYPIRLPLGIDQEDNFYLGTGINISTGPDTQDSPNIAKFDADGNLIWYHRFQSAAADYSIWAYVYGLDVDPSGRAYVTGTIWGQVDLDGDGYADIDTINRNVTPAVQISPAFVARYTPEGQIDWTHTVWHDGVRTRTSSGLALSATEQGAYVLGEYQDSLDPDGPGPLAPLLQRSEFTERFVMYAGEVINTDTEKVHSGWETITSPAPNPFADQSRFTISLEVTQHIQIQLYDMLGRQVQHVFSGQLPHNQQHAFAIAADHLPAGTYLLRVLGSQFNKSELVTVIK